MEKSKLIRFMILAAGVVLSAAFYGISGEAPEGAFSIDSEILSLKRSGKASGAEIVSLSGFQESGRNTEDFSTGDSSDISQEVLQLVTEAGLTDRQKDEVALIVRNTVYTMINEGALPDGSAASGNGMININTADKAQLMTLPGFGEVRADAVLAYRDEFGFFEEPEDIMKVNGIKQAAFDRIKDRITV